MISSESPNVIESFFALFLSLSISVAYFHKCIVSQVNIDVDCDDQNDEELVRARISFHLSSAFL